MQGWVILPDPFKNPIWRPFWIVEKQETKSLETFITARKGDRIREGWGKGRALYIELGK